MHRSRTLAAGLALTAFVTGGVIGLASPASEASPMVCATEPRPPAIGAPNTIRAYGIMSCWAGEDAVGVAVPFEQVKWIDVEVTIQRDKPADGLGWVDVAIAGDATGPGRYNRAFADAMPEYRGGRAQQDVRYRTEVSGTAASYGGRVVEQDAYSAPVTLNVS